MTISSEITSILEEIFDTSLAIDVTHTYGVNSETLRAFFDQPYDSSTPFNTGFENASTTLLLQTADMTHVTSSSTFTISGTVYYVSEIYEDVNGTTKIAISLASAK